jgi:hypothetical protein
MKKLIALIAGTGLLALGACSTTATDDAGVENTQQAASGSATLGLNTWNTGYTATITLTNNLPTQTSHWTVIIDLNGSTVSGAPWNAVLSGTSGKVNATPMNYNTNIAPGATVSFGFNGAYTNTANTPKLLAWNFDLGTYATNCDTDNGSNPVLASLAVAMGDELGRWDAINDLAPTGPNGRMQLSSTAVCKKNNCAKTKALLALGDDSVQQYYYPQSLFTVGNYRSMVGTSRSNQVNANSSQGAPPAHKLTLVAGPKVLATNPCGPHFVFQADDANGNPLSAQAAKDLRKALCAYRFSIAGGFGCGSNPYVSPLVIPPGGTCPSGVTCKVDASCPAGKMCVAIDPGDGDVTGTNTTSAGSAPTYYQNRVTTLDPANPAPPVGSACITTAGKLGTLQDKCAVSAATCGWLYCIPS